MTNRISMRAIAIGAVLAAAVATPAFAQQGQQESMTVIETTPGIEDVPFLAAQKIASEFKFEIKVATFNGGGEAGEVFLGGRGDMLLAGGDKAIAMNKLKPDSVKLVGSVLNSGGWSVAVPKDSPIKTLADLKGKTIGVTGPGASSEGFVRYGVHSVGLNPDKDVQIIALGAPPNILAALQNKKIDAAALAGPYLLFPRQDGSIRILGDYEQIKYPGDEFIAFSKDIGPKAELFSRFFTVFREALKRVKNDHAFAMKLAKERFPKGYSDEQLTALVDYHEKVLWAPMDGLVTREMYTNGTAIWTGAGRYTQADIPDYDKLVANPPSEKK